MNIPMVVEQNGNAYDIYSRLLKERIIFINQPITNEFSNIIIAEILMLQSEEKEKPIHIYINSPGGSGTGMLAIYDVIQISKTIICTYCVGEACSAAALLLASGTHGHRFSLPNSRIMIHQPAGEVMGTASDIKIQADEIIGLRLRVNRILSFHWGKAVDEVATDTERDKFMSPEEAKAYGSKGIIDKTIGTPIPKGGDATGI